MNGLGTLIMMNEYKKRVEEAKKSKKNDVEKEGVENVKNKEDSIRINEER